MGRCDAAGFDACVVGAGMAGLSAALMLGRARRATLVADAGTGRNAAARAVHGVLGHDGTPPEQLCALARQQAASYPDVTVAASPVTQVAGKTDAFEIVLADGQCYGARRVLLATGIADELPPIEGLRPLWGRTVVHCPYCHGWELRGQPLAFLILRPADVFLGLKLTQLSSDVVGLLNGAPDPPPAEQEMLREAGITLRAEPIARLARDGDRLRQVIFTDGMCLDRAGLFVHPPARQAAPFAAAWAATCCLIASSPSTTWAGLASRECTQQGIWAAALPCRFPASWQLSPPRPARSRQSQPTRSCCSPTQERPCPGRSAGTAIPGPCSRPLGLVEQARLLGGPVNRLDLAECGRSCCTGRRVGRPQRGRAAAGLRQVHRRPAERGQAPHRGRDAAARWRRARQHQPAIGPGPARRGALGPVRTSTRICHSHPPQPPRAGHHRIRQAGTRQFPACMLAGQGRFSQVIAEGVGSEPTVTV